MMSESTTTKPILVVLGATGSQGGATLRYLAAHKSQHNYALRGITRNPSSAASRALDSLGVEMVQGDLLDLGSLITAFTGAHAIFATTDSNQLIFNAIQQPEILQSGQTPRSYAREIEERMGRNLRDAAVRTEGLKRLVWSSLPSPKKWSRGRFDKVDMFDVKEEIADELWECEGLRGKVSVLLIGFYADNALRMPEFYGPKKQPDGVYELALPISSTTLVPIADLDRDLGNWVLALLHAEPGLILLGQSEALTWEQWVQLWGRQVGVAVRYRKEDPERFAALQKGITDAVAQEFQFGDEYGFTGGNTDILYPQQLRERGVSIQTSPIREHIERCDWSKLLA